MSADDKRLQELRRALDTIDDEILDRLNRRAQLVQDVAQFKRAHELPFYVPTRERLIIERLTARNAGPFPSEAIGAVLQEIISACLSLQVKLKVAYLGREGTDCRQALRQRFGTSVRPIPGRTIADVFGEVERKRAHYGVVPMENSFDAVVGETLHSFIDTELAILGEVFVPSPQNLLARHDVDEHQIERIYSPPHVFGQCRLWLSQNLPSAAFVESASTTDAARAAQIDSGGASIGSAPTACIHDLNTLYSSIQDISNCRTRFFIIGPKTEQPLASGNDATSILICLPRDRVSALFRSAATNFIEIESQPSNRRPWESMFFLDLDGHIDDPAIARLLAQVPQSSKALKLLGSYPKGRSTE